MVEKIRLGDIDELLKLFDQSTWREMHLTGPGLDLFVSKDPNARRPRIDGAASDAMPAKSTQAPASISPELPRAQAQTVPSYWIAVRAPCLGTFYGSPKPGAPPFVTIGQHVNQNAELCLIEVMKLYTSIRSSVAGTVREVLVADAALVEFDQPLLYIEPDAH